MAGRERVSSVVVLCCLTFASLILLAPAAAAANIDGESPAITAAGAHASPVALASTGFDITMPVVVGLGMLVVGIAIVAWAFLRTGPAEHR